MRWVVCACVAEGWWLKAKHWVHFFPFLFFWCNCLCRFPVAKLNWDHRYWQQKRRMAAGACPPRLQAICDVVSPLCHGLSFTGAGGGGFMLLITHGALLHAALW